MKRHHLTELIAKEDAYYAPGWALAIHARKQCSKKNAMVAIKDFTMKNVTNIIKNPISANIPSDANHAGLFGTYGVIHAETHELENNELDMCVARNIVKNAEKFIVKREDVSLNHTNYSTNLPVHILPSTLRPHSTRTVAKGVGAIVQILLVPKSPAQIALTMANGITH
jgi:hypothetical protein